MPRSDIVIGVTCCLQWLITAKKVRDEMLEVWDIMWEMKEKIVTLLDSENDG